MGMNVEMEAFYRHKDGGLYFTVDVSSSTVDQFRWVVYFHVWPFESKTWHRPIEEWTPDRFERVNGTKVKEILSLNRE